MRRFSSVRPTTRQFNISRTFSLAAKARRIAMDLMSIRKADPKTRSENPIRKPSKPPWKPWKSWRILMEMTWPSKLRFHLKLSKIWWQIWDVVSVCSSWSLLGEQNMSVSTTHPQHGSWVTEWISDGLYTSIPKHVKHVMINIFKRIPQICLSSCDDHDGKKSAMINMW